MASDNVLKDAADLVRSVLSKNFGQKIDDEALSLAAKKVAASVPTESRKKAA